MTIEKPSPNYIKEIALAAHPALAMLAGIDLGVFSVLKDKPMNAHDIAATLCLRQDKLEPLLYALVTGKLLKLKENLSNICSYRIYRDFIDDVPFCNRQEISQEEINVAPTLKERFFQ